MNLLDAVTHLQGFRHYEDTHVGRFVEGLLNILNPDLVVLHKTVHTLTYHPQTFLQGLLESTADGHYLTHALHRRTQLTLHPVELREVPTGNLDDHIVKGRLEEGTRGLRHRVLQFEESVTQSQFSGDKSQGIARGLRCQCR